MEPNPIQPRPASHHPVIILAALAVVLFCLVGTAAVLGWLPSSQGGNRAAHELGVAAPPAAQPLPAPASAAAQPSPSMAGQLASAAPAGTSVGAAPASASPVHAARPARPAANERAERWCANCGNIESIRTITNRAQGSGIGAAGGAVLGGLLGNQVGAGNGRSLATVAGAVGGAVLGNQVEGKMRAVHSYEIRVRLDDGTLRTFHQSGRPDWHTGQRVRIVKGRLRPA